MSRGPLRQKIRLFHLVLEVTVDGGIKGTKTQESSWLGIGLYHILAGLCWTSDLQPPLASGDLAMQSVGHGCCWC